ncbi:hypothetical protein EW026_g5087 [Hermanssonia centrifuga]|uniref:Oxidoreductase N-terminal domain-containing protein n=1 Tax=Hermanssonia centrifuga TaxID=98765 RepID=A0A4S4KF93_9APHY|nr:hypothetical protein EW026_g5087 [Hermanssonia centrifuga]
MSQYTRIVLAERPQSEIDSKTFRTEIVPFDLRPNAKQILVQTIYLSLDPTQRTWLNDTRGYMKPVQIGEVMRSGGIGVVIQAGSGSRFQRGDTVFGMLGWREYVVLDDNDPGLARIEVPPGVELIDFLGPLGITGLTAYFVGPGLLKPYVLR